MAYYNDLWKPDYMASVAVDGTQTYTGDTVQLAGAVAVTVQAISANGAAGTVYVDGTNQAGKSPTWLPMGNSALAGNGSTTLVYVGTDALTNMHQMRVRFVSTAAGNFTAAVNVRMVGS